MIEPAIHDADAEPSDQRMRLTDTAFQALAPVPVLSRTFRRDAWPVGPTNAQIQRRILKPTAGGFANRLARAAPARPAGDAQRCYGPEGPSDG